MSEFIDQEKAMNNLYTANINYIITLHQRIESLEAALDNVIKLGYTEVEDILLLKSEIMPENLYMLYQHKMCIVYEVIHQHMGPPLVAIKTNYGMQTISGVTLYRRDYK